MNDSNVSRDARDNGRPAMTKKRLLRIGGAWAAGVGIVLGVAGWLAGIQSLTMVGAVLLVVGAAWLVCSRFACDEPLRTVQLRYVRQFMPAMILYMVLLFAASALIDHVHSAPLKVLVALLPVVPVAWLLRALVQFLLGSDELEQRQQLEAIAIAASSVALLSFAAGFLQAADLVQIEAPLIWVLPIMFAIYGLAMAWIRRRYRG